MSMGQVAAEVAEIFKVPFSRDPQFPGDLEELMSVIAAVGRFEEDLRARLGCYGDYRSAAHLIAGKLGTGNALSAAVVQHANASAQEADKIAAELVRLQAAIADLNKIARSLAMLVGLADAERGRSVEAAVEYFRRAGVSAELLLAIQRLK